MVWVIVAVLAIAAMRETAAASVIEVELVIEAMPETAAASVTEEVQLGTEPEIVVA